MRLSAQAKVAIGLALVAVNLAVLAVVLASPWNGPLSFGGYRLDLDVYRIGSTVWRHGGDLYGALPPIHHQELLFTYPPVSAILLAPLSMVPFWMASLGISVLTVGSVLVVVAMVLRRADLRLSGRDRWLLAGALAPLALLVEPVRSTLDFGQVNAVLMLLVVVDCLATRPRWPRGVLVGLAAAMKLTPAAFLLFFLLRRDRRSALRAAASFAVITGIGFVLDPADSVRYWTGAVFKTSRIGGAGWADNQSIMGVLARFGLQSSVRSGVWVALVVVVLGLAVLGMRRALAAGQVVFALCLAAVAELLCSPVSWSHHWVWSVPLLLTLAIVGLRSRAVLPLAFVAVGLALFLLTAPTLWTLSGHLGISADVSFGLLLLLAAAFVPVGARRTPGPISGQVVVSPDEALVSASRD